MTQCPVGPNPFDVITVTVLPEAVVYESQVEIPIDSNRESENTVIPIVESNVESVKMQEVDLSPPIVETEKKTPTVWPYRFVFCGIGIAALSMLLPVPYKVHCESVIEPVLRRYVASPFEGTLDTTFAKAGDFVRQGDLLAKMDGREIDSQRSSLFTDWNQALKKQIGRAHV